MRFLADPRRRSIALLTGGVVLIFVLLGTLQAFNTSNVNFLNPATYSQTIALTSLELLLFLLLLLLLKHRNDEKNVSKSNQLPTFGLKSK